VIGRLDIIHLISRFRDDYRRSLDQIFITI
jgi:hypothetical protein